MFRRSGLTVAILTTAVGVPYAMWNGGSVSDWMSGSEASQQADPSHGPEPLATTYDGEPVVQPVVVPAEQPGMAEDSVVPLTGPKVDHLSEIFNFEITPPWITNRWSRVSTHLADLQLSGMRVALVTGTRTDDLSGALTYYFDAKGRLQRITFQGTTGDDSRLVQLLTDELDFSKRPNVNEAVYVRESYSRPTGVCRIRSAPVLWSTAANSRYQVELEISRSDWSSGLSQITRGWIDW